MGLWESPVEFAVLAVELHDPDGVESVLADDPAGAEAELDHFGDAGVAHVLPELARHDGGVGAEGVLEGVEGLDGVFGEEGVVGLEFGFAEGGLELGFVVGGLGDELPLSVVGSEEADHLLGEFVLVEFVGVVEVLSHLVLVDPAELLEEGGVCGVALEGLVADELDASLDPAPAVLEAGEGDGDVVGHVPGEEGGGGGVARLELDDPAGELDHLEVVALLLHLGGAEPEVVGEESAEAAEGDGGEGEHGRGVLERLGVGELLLVADGVEP